MAHDDDYWRGRDRMDDQDWLAKRASETTRRLNEALRDRDWAKARELTGVPPPEAASDDLDEPERTDPPTAGEQFREHKHALLFNLEWVYDFLLPEDLRRNWAMRVAPLDIEQPEAGLAVIEAIRDEYERAVYGYQPSNSEVSRRIDWDYQIPRIGDEIEWVERLFRHVLSFR
jgi:hypothetical protein